MGQDYLTAQLIDFLTRSLRGPDNLGEGLMPAIPLGQASYDRADLPKVTLKNMYYERAPTNLEDQVALIPRPRLSAFATAGAGPINGTYRKGGVLSAAGTSSSGAIIALSNDQLYKINQNTGVATLIGTVEGSASRMSAEGNDNVVVLARGTKAYYTNGVTLTQITFPDSFNVFAVDTLNSYFLFASQLGRFYWSAIGGTTVDALDYATAESQPDDLMTLKVIGDELWLFGRLSVEVWQPTGDLDLPFQRITGRIFGIGITARDTCQKINVNGIDKVCWVGTDRRVYWTNPNPERLSTPWLEAKLRKATVSATDNSVNPYGFTASWEGHDFYVLHIPGEGTFACELTNGGQWDEWTSHERSFFRAAVSAVGVNSQPLLGDDTGATIWEFVNTQETDGDDPVLFRFTGLLEVPDAPLRCNNVSLDLASGTSDDPEEDPTIRMDWSNDLGETFEEGEAQPLGRQGERNTRVMWSRLGMLRRPGRLFTWETTSPVTVRKAKYNGSTR